METMESAAKKQKRNYYYQANWEQDYFVTSVGEKCACLVCKYVFVVNRKSSVVKHFLNVHEGFDVEFPKGSEERKAEIERLKMGGFPKPKPLEPAKVVKSGVTSTTRLSFRIAFILAKGMRPFDDGAIAKEMMVEMADELIQNDEVRHYLLEKINDTPLSGATMARRVKSISGNIHNQLTEHLQNCDCFSLQVDETSDYVETPTLVVLVRMVMDDCATAEEMLSVIQLKRRPSAEDLFAALTEDLTAKKVPLGKLVSITTNGAPTVIQRQAKLVELCKGDPRFSSTLLNFHGISRLLTTCVKSVDMSHVVQPIVKMVGTIKTAKSLQQRLFSSLLQEVGGDCNGLSTHLSGSKVLERFHESLPQIREFFKFRNEDVPELEDEDWLMDLAFFADLNKTVDDLDHKIRRRDTPVWTSITHIVEFRRQIRLWKEFLEDNEISDAFKQLNKTLEELGKKDDFCGKRFAGHLVNLVTELEQKFEEFEPIEIVRGYFCSPMRQEDTRAIAASMTKLFPAMNALKLREEMVSLCHNENCRFAIAKSVNTDEFWKTVDQQQYVNLVRIYKQLLSCFGSSGLCETIFNSMRLVNRGLRSRITSENLEGIVRISASTYEPDFQKLSQSTRSKTTEIIPVE